MDSAAPQVSRQSLLYLLVAQAVVIVPLLFYLPLWLGLVWLVAVVMRWQVYRGVWRYPGNFAKALLGLLCIGGLAFQYGVHMGVEPMVGLLLAAFMLKLVEARQRRDQLMMIFIGFVAVAALFLFWQSMAAALVALAGCVALLMAWRACFATQPLRLRAHLQPTAQLLLQALPLMILLFLILPRLGPLWSVAPIKSSGTTGFSDSMAPGDIAQLSLSSKVAFRVTFEGVEPAKSQMYWRGLVLDHFDGRRWTSSENPYALPQAAGEKAADAWDMTSTDTPVTYNLMLEPHQERWLFFLETPLEIDAAFATSFTNSHLIRARWPVTSRVQYQVRSDLAAGRDLSGLKHLVRDRNLRLPASPANPRTHRLVASWQGLSPREMVGEALELYQRQFRYTLRPPTLGANSIDEFLFITRSGFCEHFASSFVYLMRAAGVPARLVVGYQGGERSEVNDYWLIRQSSAHVWAEVWLAEQGWVRVDPTAVVAPSRIDMGLDEALGADEVYLAGGENLLTAQNWRWMRRLQHHWDAAGYTWHQAVMGYDSSTQTSLFKRLLGGADIWRIGLAFLAGGAGLLGFYWLVSWYSRRPPPAALEMRLLQQAERRLGVDREAAESAGQWARRVARTYPQRKQAADRVARMFEAIVYAGRREYLNKLQTTVKTLPKK